MEYRVSYVMFMLLGGEAGGVEYWWRAARVAKHPCI
jgi:hypothetical protein